jgi:ABC-type phosphate/phosphonate transport system substrate-binding protein
MPASPELAQRVRVLAPTPPSPAIPFVTSVATSAPMVAILHAAMRRIVAEERYRPVREGLMLADIVDVSDTSYRALLDYEREAAALGYPSLE